MALSLIPRGLWDFPTRMPSLLDDEDFFSNANNGLSISEDDKHVYVEAHVPGIDPSKIEVTYNKGVLWIKGASETKEEDKDKKFYRRATSSFSYHVTVPGNIDESHEPDATCKNGVMRVSFKKMEEAQPRRLSVKEG